MPRFRTNNKLIFAHHLSNHKFLVQAVCSRQYQELSAFGVEKLFAEPGKPGGPERSGDWEIGMPGVVDFGVLERRDGGLNEGGDGDAGGFWVAKGM